MKKTVIVTLCNVVLITCIMTCVAIFYPYSFNIEAATLNQVHTLDDLKSLATELSNEIVVLQENMATYEETISTLNTQIEDMAASYSNLEIVLVSYYLERLSDTTYCELYNEDYIYYTAAENLGIIGKPAIPKLIDKLSTTDDYERALALYALMLASQADNVKAFSADEYIHANLDFDSRNHPEQVKTAMDWWEKYKDYF